MDLKTIIIILIGVHFNVKNFPVQIIPNQIKKNYNQKPLNYESFSTDVTQNKTNHVSPGCVSNRCTWPLTITVDNGLSTLDLLSYNFRKKLARLTVSEEISTADDYIRKLSLYYCFSFFFTEIFKVFLDIKEECFFVVHNKNVKTKAAKLSLKYFICKLCCRIS